MADQTDQKKGFGAALGKFFGFAFTVFAVVFVGSEIVWNFLLPIAWQGIPKVDLLIVGMLPLIMVGVVWSIRYFLQDRVLDALMWALLFVGLPATTLLLVYFGQMLALIFGALFLLVEAILFIRSVIIALKAGRAKGKGKPQQAGHQQTRQMVDERVQGRVVVQAPAAPGEELEPIDLTDLRRREVVAKEDLVQEQKKRNLLDLLPHLKELAAFDKSSIGWSDVDAVVRATAALQQPGKPAETVEEATLRAKRMQARGTRIF